MIELTDKRLTKNNKLVVQEAELNLSELFSDIANKQQSQQTKYLKTLLIE